MWGPLFNNKKRPLDNDKEPQVLKSEEEPVEVCQRCGKALCECEVEVKHEPESIY